MGRYTRRLQQKNINGTNTVQEKGSGFFTADIREGNLVDILTESSNTAWNFPEREKDFPREVIAWATVWR